MNVTLRKRALFLSIGLFFIMIISCIIILLRYYDTSEQYTAYIYQDGILVQSIDLAKVTDEYTLEFIATNSGKNLVLVQPGGISVTYADCPDQICVHQGIIRNSLLPITCLPHGLVIELKSNGTTIDTITYSERALMKTLNTKHLTQLALFTTLALAIYSVEAALPTLVPIPGVKLGLSNIITLIVLRNLSAKDAFFVLVARILIATFLFGQAMSMLYSLSGGILCLLVMMFLNRLLQRHFLFLTSIFGALAHNAGQLIIAVILTASVAALTYIPFFVVSACITGLFTGLCAEFAQKHLGKLIASQRIQ